MQNVSDSPSTKVDGYVKTPNAERRTPGLGRTLTNAERVQVGPVYRPADVRLRRAAGSPNAAL